MVRTWQCQHKLTWLLQCLVHLDLWQWMTKRVSDEKKNRMQWGHLHFTRQGTPARSLWLYQARCLDPTWKGDWLFALLPSQIFHGHSLALNTTVLAVPSDCSWLSRASGLRSASKRSKTSFQCTTMARWCQKYLDGAETALVSCTIWEGCSNSTGGPRSLILLCPYCCRSRSRRHQWARRQHIQPWSFRPCGCRRYPSTPFQACCSQP